MVLLGGSGPVQTNAVANALDKVMDEQVLLAKIGLGVDVDTARKAVLQAARRQPVGELLSYLEFIGSPFDAAEADARPAAGSTTDNLGERTRYLAHRYWAFMNLLCLVHFFYRSGGRIHPPGPRALRHNLVNVDFRRNF